MSNGLRLLDPIEGDLALDRSRERLLAPHSGYSVQSARPRLRLRSRGLILPESGLETKLVGSKPGPKLALVPDLERGGDRLLLLKLDLQETILLIDLPLDGDRPEWIEVTLTESGREGDLI